jgi:hypothetical protein
VNEVWFRLRSRALPRPVVVLDVSAAAAPLWPVLLGTVEGLAEELPEPDRPDVVFLGGTERFPLDRFLRSADELSAVNQGRGRVISPLLESFGESWPARVTVVAVRPVWDLADWRETPNGGRLAVVRTDPTVPVSGGGFRETDLTDVPAVAAVVARRPSAVRVGVLGGIPVWWDNETYRFEDGRLTANARLDTAVRAGFLCANDGPEPTAELVWADGGTDQLPIEWIEPPSRPVWRPFTATELTALTAWRGGRPAHCPACRTDHPPGVVVCPTGPGLLPSLDGLPSGSLARLRVKMFQAAYDPVAGPVLRVGEAVVVRVSPGGRPVVWRFDSGEDRWRPTDEPWGLFERTGPDDEFALTLPGGDG